MVERILCWEAGRKKAEKNNFLIETKKKNNQQAITNGGKKVTRKDKNDPTPQVCSDTS